MQRQPVIIELGDKAPGQQDAPQPEQPPPEDELGGGDICSPEESPPTEDDRPLP